MRRAIYCLLLFVLGSCAIILPPDNDEVARQLTEQLNNRELVNAHRLYQSLSTTQQNYPAVIQQQQRLQQQLTAIRANTEQQANQAMAEGEWRKAANIFHAQLPLIKIDDAFHTSYAQFLQKIDQQKLPTLNNFLLIEAEYLIEKRKMLRLIEQIDPHDSTNNQQLADTEQAAKTVSKQLLTLGMDAVKTNNINSARILIPLAQALDNSKTVRNASRVLEQLTTPLADYIAKLTDYGTELYSNEDYKNAFEIWEVILYLDPNNIKVKANRDRTEKVLQSLEKIKQDVIEKNGHSAAPAASEP
jgi:tetratricopeptide (TPR) repeat protein